MVTSIFGTGRSHTIRGAFTTLNIIKPKTFFFKIMWTSICRCRRVLDFVTAHIAILGEL